MNTKEKIILGFASAFLIGLVALASSGVLSNKTGSSDVFSKMAEANTAVSSSHIDMTIRGDFEAGNGAGAVSFVGQFVGTGSKTQASQNADFNFKIQGSASGDSEITAQGDFRLLDRVVYLRVTQLPPIPFLDKNMIVGKWFSVDPISLYKELGDAKAAAEVEQALSANSKMPAEFVQKSYALAYREGVISKINPKGNELVSGVTTQKYELTINTSKIPDFLVKYTELYNEYAPQAGLELLPERAISEEDRSMFASMTFSPVLVWIGKADYLPYKVAFTITIDGALSELQGASMNGTLSIEALMSDYNKPVTVEKPSPVAPIESLFKSLMGGM